MSEYRTSRFESLTFQNYLSYTFITCAFGLLISAVSAFITNMAFYYIPYQMMSMFVLLAILIELGVAFFFSFKLMSMSKTTAWICYIIYCLTTGISLSLVIKSYSTGTVVSAFISTAILFICMSIIGHTTKVDITKFGGLLTGALITIIITTLLNVFLFKSSGLDLLLCYVGIITFLGLIAYDVRRLRDLYNNGLADSEVGEKLMVFGAFQLYLDFINLFIRLLRLFSRRRD